MLAILAVFVTSCGSVTSSEPTVDAPTENNATYNILVFGSLEPDINQHIADFLNEETDMVAVASTNDEDVSAGNLGNYNVVIDYDHDGMSDGMQQSLADFVAVGGKLIGLHHAIYDPPNTMAIKHELYGAYLPSHCCRVEPEPYQVILVDPSNAVFDTLETSGTVSYGSNLVTETVYPYYELPVLDERYTEIVFLQDSGVHILLSTIFGETSYDIGWYRASGNGKVYYYQIGHLDEMFGVDWYQKLIINAIHSN